MTETGASPYSTGGGGVTFEHTYAATLLVHLLSGDPIHELGDSLAVDRVRLQASNVSAVDDIVIDGHDESGDVHRASIGVRRDPALTTSDGPSVPLFGDYIRVVTDNWAEVSTGAWSLNLAVATHRPAYTQMSKLAVIARSTPDAQTFLAAVARPRAVNRDDRTRLEHLTALVKKASGMSPVGADELLWRLLANLKIRTLRLEGVDLSDRTQAVAALRRVVADESAATADNVFTTISELTRRWASNGAVIDEAMLRRALRAHPLKRSAAQRPAWRVLDRYATQLRQAVRPSLGSGSETMEFERIAERTALAEKFQQTGETCGVLIVTGDPDVGKSALSLRVLEGLRDEGATTISLSLRDMPDDIAVLEDLLGNCSLRDVLSAVETHTIQLMLLDGTESTLAGKTLIFRHLIVSALEAGIGVIAVTRSDGARQVRRDLQYAIEIIGSPSELSEYTVDSLESNERRLLTTTFGALNRLNEDPRAEWLLGRPGLVDALLRTDETIEPSDVLCEAAVFATVWNGLIRSHERQASGESSPDDRERVAVNVARRLLGADGEPNRGTAAAELRSNGVLRASANPAFAVGDEFATDLFRDFALCRLFVTHDWNVLAEAGAPRWSLRAVRLACQVRLLGSDREAVWTQLNSRFNLLAEHEGKRWSEVPYEALLSLGDADTAITQLWEQLNANESRGAQTLLRIAKTRYVKSGIGDRFALAPVVDAAFCRRQNSCEERSTRVSEELRELVLAWLRGVILTERESHPLRRRVRDAVLQSEPSHHDKFAIEALALLGPDLNDRAEAWLRKVAEQRPINLSTAVESSVVAFGMARDHPSLLLDLAEKYYIDKPDEDRHRWGNSRRHDYGIRDFRHGSGIGYGASASAWHYGPFWQLLLHIPRDAAAFINRMLDHAASHRVGPGTAGDTSALPGVDLTVPGSSNRHFTGDSNVWAWYRGTGVGPYPCMSALLALERFADHLYEEVELSAAQVVDFAMRDCHNMATPGLIVGFLTRHLTSVGDTLDTFLTHPEVWNLESDRAAGDFGFHVRDSDADNLTGTRRRRYSPHETVIEMVLTARNAGDDRRLMQLAQVGDELLKNARTRLSAGSEYPEDAAVFEGWAAKFRVENYRSVTTEQGSFTEFRPPSHVETVLAPRNEEAEITNTLLGFRNRYAHPHDDPSKWSMADLGRDLAVARRIHDGGTSQDGVWPEDSFAALASAAIQAHALLLTAVDYSNLRWAIEIVLRAAAEPQIDEFSYHKTYFMQGADRAAARAIPLLSLSPFDELDIDRARTKRCLEALASSLFDEVRTAYSEGCVRIWQEPCAVEESSGRCIRHNAAWEAVVRSLADCRSGPWDDESQQREHHPVPPPYDQTLNEIADDELLVNHLRMPAVCMSDAKATSCVRDEVEALWTSVWDAHRRGLYSWSSQGYDHNEIRSSFPVARRLLRLAQHGEPEMLYAHLKTFAAESHSLHHLMEGMMHSLTYDDSLRNSMHALWPPIMGVALDTIGDGSTLGGPTGSWFDYAVSSILPVPQPDPYAPGFDATLANCRASWVDPSAIDGLDVRWLRLARGIPKAVDALVQFARTTPLAWQRTTGLSWLEFLLDNQFEHFANRLTSAVEWLTEHRTAAALSEPTRSQYTRIVDGLAAAGDRDAVALQQLDE